MTIQEILVLISAAFILGYLFRQTKQVNTLLAASTLLVFWLQPETGLRYLGYWLPAIASGLMVLSWFIISSPETRNPTETLKTLLIIVSVYLLLTLLRYLGLDRESGFAAVPGILSTVVFLVPTFSLLSFLSWRKVKIHPAGLWMLFLLLILIFVILKTPYLAGKASHIWRSLAGQSLALANSSELSWLGYSYFAFRILGTIRDKQSGRFKEMALNEYITYLVLFPSFVAGPIARADQFSATLREFTGTFRDDLIEGGKRIIIGLFKKFVLADSLALIALNSQNALQSNSAWGSWLLLYAFSFQIYFDFSGYTDIALGLARFLNIQLPENFNRPYLKPNLTQFWSNWHITLTNWFRAYFFNPISRSLRKKKTPAFWILLITQISTMVLVGLWHGITVNFVLWGFWHGLGLLVQNRWSSWIKKHLPPSEKKWIQVLRDSAGTVLTFHYVTLGWIWFVLPSTGLARDFFLTLFKVGL